MADDTNGKKARVRELKEQLVKAARMYAMCQKAEVPEPMDVTGLAVAAFEDMQLREAMLFVRTNERNIKDLAWALGNSNSAQEFEQRVKDIKTLPDRNEPRR
jgi:hypothetical protein